METRSRKAQALKRTQEIEKPPENLKKKLNIKTMRCLGNNLQQVNKSEADFLKSFPNPDIKIERNYNELPEEQRLFLFAEDVALEIKAQAIKLNDKHQALKEASCYMLDTFISNLKVAQVNNYISRREKEDRISNERNILASLLVNANENWDKVCEVCFRSIESVRLQNEIMYLDQIQSK